MTQELEKWTSSLGLLPVYMMHNSMDGDKRYALLDGDSNNFCLDFGNDDDGDVRSLAWSANMRNYVQIRDEKVFLYTLDTHTPEVIKESFVLQNISKFYDYLGELSKGQQQIVPFLMKSFRMLRNAFRDKNSAENSLTTFLYVLSSLNGDRVDLGKWGLPNDTYDIVGSLKNNGLVQQTIEEIRAGLQGRFIPDLNMILRHASGNLFEEANFYAYFKGELDLFPTSQIEYAYNPNAVGAYFTPPFLARTIVEECLRNLDVSHKEKIVIFDPACGSGQFLLETLRQLKFQSYRGKVEIIGWDIAPIAKLMTDYQLCFEKKEWGDKLTFSVETKDSLYNKWPLDVDLLLMNPPYKSWEVMPLEMRHQVEVVLEEKPGKINLASVFYLLGVRILKRDGVLGCVIPSSFLTSDATMKIRKEAFDAVSPKLIGKLGNFIFRSAYVDVCMIVASNNCEDNYTQMLWADNRDNVVHQALRDLRVINNGHQVFSFGEKSYSIYKEKKTQMQTSDLWSPIPETANVLREKLEIKLMMGVLRKVGDVFDVKTGARTGNNQAFLLSSEEYKELPAKERKYFRPSVDRDSIIDGKLYKCNYIFFPYPEVTYPIEDEKDLEQKLGSYYKKYLLPNKNVLVRRYQASPKWWLLSRPGPWQFDKELKLVSKEWGKAGDFTIDTTGEFAVQGGCMWAPKDKDKEQNRLFAYIPYLNSSLFNNILRIYSKQLSGGEWYVLEKKYASKFPIPNFDKMEDSVVQTLKAIGRKIVYGEEYDHEVVDNIIKGIIYG